MTPSFVRRGLRLLSVLLVAGPLVAAEVKPLFEADLAKASAGPLPDSDFLVLDGAFEIKEEGGKKFIELPGAPLDTYGVLFGPTQVDGVSVTARIHGTKQGRRFPTFAVGLNGAGGYRLQVSPAKKQIELLKGDEVKAGAPFDWQSDTWTVLRLQVRKVKDGAWKIEGRAWTDGSAEPATWGIVFDDTDAPAAGRGSIWGAPFANTPIRFTHLAVLPAQ